MTVAPITKEQAQEKVDDRIFPDFVIQAFNECISEAKIKKTSYVYQKDVVDKILTLAPKGTKRNTIFDEHWLDVENHYRKAGWKVEFYKPHYSETQSEAYFKFY